MKEVRQSKTNTVCSRWYRELKKKKQQKTLSKPPKVNQADTESRLAAATGRGGWANWVTKRVRRNRLRVVKEKGLGNVMFSVGTSVQDNTWHNCKSLREKIIQVLFARKN